MRSPLPTKPFDVLEPETVEIAPGRKGEEGESEGIRRTHNLHVPRPWCPQLIGCEVAAWQAMEQWRLLNKVRESS
jgi:hypothetical protein